MGTLDACAVALDACAGAVDGVAVAVVAAKRINYGVRIKRKADKLRGQNVEQILEDSTFRPTHPHEASV